MPAGDLSRRWTLEEVLALPDDGNLYELIDGELHVSPAPRWLHQDAILELALVIQPYVKAHRIGRFGQAPADLDLRSGQRVQPDLFVAGLVKGRLPREWKEAGVPLLIVEVLSPSDPEYDREVKRILYQKAGVPTYWIVDVEQERVEVWTPDAVASRVERARLRWAPREGIPALELDLPAYFRAVRQAG